MEVYEPWKADTGESSYRHTLWYHSVHGGVFVVVLAVFPNTHIVALIQIVYIRK